MQSPLRAKCLRFHLRNGNFIDNRRPTHNIAAPTFNVCDHSRFLSLELAHCTLNSGAAFTGTRAIRSPTALRRRVHTRMSVRDVSEPAHVVVLSRLAPLLSPMLQERCGRHIESVSVVDPKDPDVQVLAGAQVIVADPPLFAPIADRCSSLVWMQSTFAGCDALIKNTTKRDYTVTRLAGCFGPPMAEYTVMHMLALERGLKASYRTLRGRVLGVLGVGDIGSAVAAAAGALGMEVWGYRRSGKQVVAGVARMFGPEELQDFLGGCHYLVNTLPSTPETRALLCDASLPACKGTVLINVGRADIVEEDCLLSALDQGHLSHAVLDVFSQEPLPKVRVCPHHLIQRFVRWTGFPQESALWTHPRVTISPHCAAETFPEDVVDAFATNLDLFQSKQQLLHSLDWTRGY